MRGRDRQRQREQPDPLVEPQHRGGDRADERDVAERIAGEHLRPQHHEPADVPQASAIGVPAR